MYLRTVALAFVALLGIFYIATFIDKTDKLFKGSAELLFSHLVSDQKLSPEQITRMRKLLSERDDKEKP